MTLISPFEIELRKTVKHDRVEAERLWGNSLIATLHTSSYNFQDNRVLAVLTIGREVLGIDTVECTEMLEKPLSKGFRAV